MKRNTNTSGDKPSDGAILERSFSLVNEAMFTIALQRRRVRSDEPEDKTFIFRRWADLQFLIVALRRLRRATQLASQVVYSRDELLNAIKTFDTALPGLATMRNVGEHIDDYALDSERRRHKHITRRQLQVGTWDGTTYEWLDFKLNVDEAHDAALALFRIVRAAVKAYPKAGIPRAEEKN